jgi:hypothetical protein
MRPKHKKHNHSPPTAKSQKLTNAKHISHIDAEIHPLPETPTTIKNCQSNHTYKQYTNRNNIHDSIPKSNFKKWEKEGIHKQQYSFDVQNKSNPANYTTDSSRNFNQNTDPTDRTITTQPTKRHTVTKYPFIRQQKITMTSQASDENNYTTTNMDTAKPSQTLLGIAKSISDKITTKTTSQITAPSRTSHIWTMNVKTQKKCQQNDQHPKNHPTSKLIP